MFSVEDEGGEDCGTVTDTGPGRVSRDLIISLLSVLLVLLAVLPSEDLVMVFLSREKSDVVFDISDRLDSIGRVL